MIPKITENRVSESLVDATLEAIDSAILVVDQARKVINYNLYFAEIWQLSSPLRQLDDGDESFKLILEKLVDPQHFLDEIVKPYSQLEVEHSDKIACKDGRIFESVSRPVFLDGKMIARIWSFRDITAIENSKRTLQTEIGFRNTIIRALPDLMWLKDVSGIYLACNHRFENFF
jgi:PAS domain-containing protein